ncbi:MAG: GBS Bsp-like repeat-containing protein [Lachnospiraceae bacterium]|nr:GBS Bsp-like repeat-containing protein [Lachnospiraceae bacterium]
MQQESSDEVDEADQVNDAEAETDVETETEETDEEALDELAPVFSAEPDSNEMKATVSISDYEMPIDGKILYAAVWSAEKGQDDLTWYPLSLADQNTYSAELSVADHKSSGKYYVHFYLKHKRDSMDYLGDTAFSITHLSAESVEVQNQDTEKGTARILVSGVTSPSGVKKITVPIWSTSNQSDIKWYSAKQDADGNWYVDMDIANHKSHAGTYQIHVYAEGRNGLFQFVGKTSAKFEEIKPSAEYVKAVSDNSTGIFTVSIGKIHGVSGKYSILVPTWSKSNQSDIVWYTADRNSDGTYEVTSSIWKHNNNQGTYHSHVYVKDSAGKMTFLGSANYVFETTTQVTINATDYSLVYGIDVDTECPIPPKNCYAAVWSKEGGQDDIHWYLLDYKPNGGFKGTLDIRNHQSAGQYIVHIYMQDIKGRMFYIGSNNELSVAESQLKDLKKVSVSVMETNYPGKRTIVLRNLSTKASSVRFPIWSQTNGQDDIVWYTASKNADGDYEATFDLSKHKNNGTFYVHVYADNKFVTNSSFVIDYEEVETDFTEIAAGLKAAAANRQLILVKAYGTTAEIALLNKNSDGTWYEVVRTNGYVGRNGVAPTTEWSVTTPVGIYEIGSAFGILPDPGTELDYTQIDDTYYWIDDADSPLYNQFVTTKDTPLTWSSAEHLIDYPGPYNYSFFIKFNAEGIPAVGSCIFFHCERGIPTGGCIAVPQADMVKIMQNIHKDCKIIMDNGDNILNY